jgi:hypothetical protein
MDRERQPVSEEGTPGWVKAFAAIGLAVVVLAVVLLVFGGDHGPSRHGAPALASAA